ncbi:hypothetical protein ACOSP7_027752 [Xanthoceras sorbifolium]
MSISPLQHRAQLRELVTQHHWVGSMVGSLLACPFQAKSWAWKDNGPVSLGPSMAQWVGPNRTITFFLFIFLYNFSFLLLAPLFLLIFN